LTKALELPLPAREPNSITSFGSKAPTLQKQLQMYGTWLFSVSVKQ